MVLNLIQGIEKVSVLRQGWSIMKDTNAAASNHTLVLIPGSTDLRPFFSLTISHSSLNDSK